MRDPTTGRSVSLSSRPHASPRRPGSRISQSDHFDRTGERGSSKRRQGHKPCGGKGPRLTNSTSRLLRHPALPHGTSATPCVGRALSPTPRSFKWMWVEGAACSTRVRALIEPLGLVRQLRSIPSRSHPTPTQLGLQCSARTLALLRSELHRSPPLWRSMKLRWLPPRLPCCAQTALVRCSVRID